VVGCIDGDRMQFPYGAEPVSGRIVDRDTRAGSILRDGFQDEWLINRRARSIEQYVEVSVTVALGKCLTIHARWESHGDCTGSEATRSVGDVRRNVKVHELNRIVGDRLQARVSSERNCNIRHRRLKYGTLGFTHGY